MSYPIQQCLWESLDGVLYNKAITLAKDIAAELGVPAQALINILKMEERSKFTILPDEDMTYQCQALVKHGATFMRCRCPTLGVAQVCSNHMMASQPILQLPIVQRIVTPGSIYLMKDNEIYSIDGSQCGILTGSTVTLFEIEEEEV
jgi:hypothetical protein